MKYKVIEKGNPLNPAAPKKQYANAVNAGKFTIKDFAKGMPERERLYALGFDELREYSLKNRETVSPALQRERTWTLPENGGHDLSRVSGDLLLVTAARDVYRFHITQEHFTPFEWLQGVPDVKSVNYSETTGQLIYTKAEESWWTHHIYLKQPDRTLTLPDIRLYKVRVME
ncbi:MAG: DUF6528 family protein [Tannerella sp.]|jgi:hypothetical protein|nr:DUF6528 family protein [Tannerella sp.]